MINALIVGGLLISDSMSSSGDELIQAVEKGDSSLVSSLIAGGADVNHVNNRGDTALIRAAWKGNSDIVTILIGRGAQVNQVTLVDYSPRYRDSKFALLEAAGKYVLGTLRFDAVKKQTEVVRILLKNGADPNQIDSLYSRSALHVAAYHGYSEIVSVLIESGANVNAISFYHGLYSPLYAAAQMAHTEIVSQLIRAGADVNLLVNDRGETALMAAADGISILRQVETISLLIQAGANINAVSDDGKTALHNALNFERERGRDQVVAFLIAHGANVNQRTALGTPLMKAIARRHENKVRLLIYAGAGTSEIPGAAFNDFIHPVLSSLEKRVTDHSSLITMAFVELKKSGEQKDNMFKNAAFRDSFGEWSDVRIGMVSRIVSLLVTLKTEEDLLVTYFLAPFLANADMERLNRFGLVLSFLTAPFEIKTKIYEMMKCSDSPKLIRFIQGTFRYAILMGSIKQSFDSLLDQMYAVYSNLIADLGAIQKGLRRIADVNIGTVCQFRHGEFGIYSKFAENLNQIVLKM
jgi:ankyrin repeat protein